MSIEYHLMQYKCVLESDLAKLRHSGQAWGQVLWYLYLSTPS